MQPTGSDESENDTSELYCNFTRIEGTLEQETAQENGDADTNSTSNTSDESAEDTHSLSVEDTINAHEHINDDVESSVNESADEEMESSDDEITEESHATAPALRRSTRIRKQPERYGVAVTHQHSVHTDWQSRVAVLMELVSLFPQKIDDIYQHIIRLVTW